MGDKLKGVAVLGYTHRVKSRDALWVSEGASGDHGVYMTVAPDAVTKISVVFSKDEARLAGLALIRAADMADMPDQSCDCTTD